MKNLTLLLVLVSGLLAGYLVGDYRGRHAREALQQAIETGKTLDIERQTALAQLKRELDGISASHQQELEAIRHRSATREAAWHRARSLPGEQAKRLEAQLAAADARLGTLVARRNTATGNEQVSLDQQIVRLRQERDDLRSEIEGHACLQTRLPHAVAEALNETGANGG